MILSFFFNDTATTEIYTLSLHDALPILPHQLHRTIDRRPVPDLRPGVHDLPADAVADRPAAGLNGTNDVRPPEPVVLCQREDRKSTRLNSSHANISYAVFCLKKKKITTT